MHPVLSSQLKLAVGIGGFMSIYGIAGLIVYMVPAGNSTKIVLIALILLTVPFALLTGWLISRRGKKKKAKEAAAAAAAKAAPQDASAAESDNGSGAVPAKLTSPAGSY